MSCRPAGTQAARAQRSWLNQNRTAHGQRSRSKSKCRTSRRRSPTRAARTRSGQSSTLRTWQIFLTRCSLLGGSLTTCTIGLFIWHAYSTGICQIGASAFLLLHGSRRSTTLICDCRHESKQFKIHHAHCSACIRVLSARRSPWALRTSHTLSAYRRKQKCGRLVSVDAAKTNRPRPPAALPVIRPSRTVGAPHVAAGHSASTC